MLLSIDGIVDGVGKRLTFWATCPKFDSRTGQIYAWPAGYAVCALHNLNNQITNSTGRRNIICIRKYINIRSNPKLYNVQIADFDVLSIL